MKIVLFARILGSTRLCKISQESGLLSNFGSLPKIGNARFGRCRPLGVNTISKVSIRLEIQDNYLKCHEDLYILHSTIILTFIFND